VQVVESFTRARAQDEPSADRLVIGDGVVAVIDGSTAKPWEAPGVTGADVADVVAAEVGAIGSSAAAFVDSVTAALREFLVDAAPGARPCATVAVLVVARREVWRIGDPWLVIEGLARPPHRDLEGAVARRRASVLRSALESGYDEASLRSDDPGRAAILADLQSLAAARNAPSGQGFGALDGTPVPPAYVEVFELGPAAAEVVLATDGYPVVAGSLQRCEQALAERLARDPLLIEDPPMTKGLALGATSYDDRTYVRVRLDATT
jgi:glycerophosphoryl diester phosphodiesterase